MRAYLSHNIKGHIRVVPDVPAHYEIVENAHNKFHAGDDNSADKATPDKRHGVMTVYPVENGKDSSAGQGHGPVGVAAVKYLDETIHEIAHEKGKSVL